MPTKVIQLLSSFHVYVLARVRVGNGHTASIAVNNGLQQRCAISPVLFNLYFALVFEKWHNKMSHICSGEDFSFRYNINCNLFNCPRIKHQYATLSDVEFADDDALLVSSRQMEETAIATFHSVASSLASL